MRGRKLSSIFVKDKRSSLDKRVPVRGRKHSSTGEVVEILSSLDKRVPVRGRKHIVLQHYYYRIYSLDKRVPVRGRKRKKCKPLTYQGAV